MKTDRYTPFAVFVPIVLVIIIAQISMLNLSPLPESAPVPPTETLVPTATATPASTATLTPTLTPTITPSITPTPTPQTVFLFDRDNFPSCFTSRSGDGMKAYSLAGKLHLIVSTAGYGFQICDEQVFSNFIYEADVTLVDTAPADAEFGLITDYNTRNDGSVQFYELFVWNSSVSMYYYDDSTDDPWTELLGAVPVPVFNSGGSNHVKLIATGDTRAVFINDLFVGQVRAPNPVSGNVGVSLSNYGSPSRDQHVVYENMRGYDLTSSAILYQDSEFANGGCFGEESGEWYQTYARDGQYHVQVTAGNSFMAACHATGLETLTDFILETDIVQQEAGNAGLAFRADADSGAMYIFQIDPAGYASLVYFPSATEPATILMDWTSVQGIAAVGEVNHIKIIAIGETILIYVNDSLAAEVQDGSATGGGIALLAQASEADSQIIFDNMKVTSLVAP